MRNILIIFISTFILFGCSSMEPVFTNDEVYSSSNADELWKEALIIEVLSKTPELNSHRMNGEDENLVYFRDDGTELVVNANEEIVRSPENMGSYNYYHPENRPLAHYKADNKPWILFGNSREDSTNKAQRLDAYSQDLAIGVFLALNEKEVPLDTNSVRYDSPEEFREALKWINSFNSSDVGSIFELYSKGTTITYEQALDITKNIEGNLP